MSAPIATVEPDVVRAGDRVRWIRSVADYPATDGWTLRYYLVKAGTHITFAAVPSGADYAVDVAPATSAVWAPGLYTWTGRLEMGTTDARTVNTGTVRVLANLAAQTGGYDERSHARQALEAIQAMILRRASKEQSEFSINGRALKYLAPTELIALESHYMVMVQREEQGEAIAKGLNIGRNRLLTRFGRG